MYTCMYAYLHTIAFNYSTTTDGHNGKHHMVVAVAVAVAGIAAAVGVVAEVASSPVADVRGPSRHPAEDVAPSSASPAPAWPHTHPSTYPHRAFLLLRSQQGCRDKEVEEAVYASSQDCSDTLGACLARDDEAFLGRLASADVHGRATSLGSSA